MAVSSGRSGIAASIIPALLGSLGGFLLSLLFMQTTSDVDAGSFNNDYRYGRGLDEVEEEEHHEEGPEDEEEFELAVSESIVVIVLVLIVITIAFERAKETIEEAVDRNLKPIIESLFGELTILGFLSLFTFCVTKMGFFEALSVRIFGEEEAEELLELFESVHYALFFVMVLFVLLVLKLVSDGMKTEEEYHELDRETRDPQHIAKCVDRVAQAEQTPVPFLRRCKLLFTSAFPSIRSRRNASVADLLHFYALRREFILERSVEPPFQPAAEKNRVPEDFAFGRYLSISLGHTLAHSVHLGMTTWLCIALFTILFFFVMMAAEAQVVILAWVWAGLGLLLFLAGNIFDVHLDNINKSYAKFTIPSNGGTDQESQPLVGAPNGSEGEDLPPWCSIDFEAYLQSRSFLTKALAKAKPNRQDSLFWLERRGPHMCTLAFQLNLIFTAIYGALLVLTFLPAIYKHSSTGVFMSYVVVSIAPLLVTNIQRRHIAASMTQATSMGIHRKCQIVSHVTIEEKTAAVVRAFVVVNKLLYAAEHDLLANPSAPIDLDPARSLSSVERADIEKTFDGFDPDSSGSISPQELKDILLALGAPVSDETMDKIINALDEDGDGSIVKDEFINFYARNIMADNDERSLDERAHDMFKLFDKSGDSSITIGEFKTALDAFDYNFTVDEVGALIEELDEDDKGTIGPHEFHHLLHKFGSMFKSHRPRELPLV
mmetsp:Transcript_30078/g.66603  ORF Transcript_30078/g.66603 Transcript_30078/m.66603 type:complete len:717 (-) Transcript_30078:73-2223(-)